MSGDISSKEEEDPYDFSIPNAFANFIAASHETMLDWLQREQSVSNPEFDELLKWWNSVMEPSREERERGKRRRDEFFEEVVASSRVSNTALYTRNRAELTVSITQSEERTNRTRFNSYVPIFL